MESDKSELAAEALDLQGTLFAFVRIRIKEATYEEQPVKFVYFEIVSPALRTMLLQETVAETRNRNESLQSYTSTISHEFRTPLSTALMFLELVVKENLSDNVRRMIMLIIS